MLPACSQVCILLSPTQMSCPTPPIQLDLINKRRKRRQATTSINTRDNFEVEISFRLDGVQEYRNLTGTALEQSSRLTIYTDPVIEPLEPAVITFTSTWPVKDRILEIKVHDKLTFRMLLLQVNLSS